MKKNYNRIVFWLIVSIFVVLLCKDTVLAMWVLRSSPYSEVGYSMEAWLKNGGHIEGGALTLSFDDNQLSTVTKVLPILNKYGYKAAAGIITDDVDKNHNELTLDDLRLLQQNGWDVVSHSKTHMSAPKTQKDIKSELVDSLEWMEEHGFDKANLCYILPFGAWNPNMLRVLPHYYLLTRSIFRDFTITKPTSEYYYPLQYSYEVDNSTEIKNIIDVINNAKDNEQWVQFAFHGIVNSGASGSTVNLDDFNKIVQIMHQSKIPVLIYSDISKILLPLPSTP